MNEGDLVGFDVKGSVCFFGVLGPILKVVFTVKAVILWNSLPKELALAKPYFCLK